MYKSKTKLVIATFITLVTSMFFMNNNFAKYLNVNNNEVTQWNVVMTSDAKDLKDTQEIKFKVENNPNVAYGKIAPGAKAYATIEINLTGTKLPVDISLVVDDSQLYNALKLTTKLDNELFKSGTTKLIELENGSEFTCENGKKIVTLELKWENNDSNNINDTIFASMHDFINIPITITVKQH